MTSILTVTETILAVLIILLALFNKSSSVGFGVQSENIGIGFNSFLFKSTLFVIIVFVLNTIAMEYAFNAIERSSVV